MEPLQEPPQAIHEALKTNYNAILVRFQRRLQHQAAAGVPVPVAVMIGNINVAIRDMFGWNLVNRVVLYKGNLQDPQRIRDEMKVIKDLYDIQFNNQRTTLAEPEIYQFDTMYETVYKPVWEHKWLMVQTPEKQAPPRPRLSPTSPVGGKRDLKV